MVRYDGGLLVAGAAGRDIYAMDASADGAKGMDGLDKVG